MVTQDTILETFVAPEAPVTLYQLHAFRAGPGELGLHVVVYSTGHSRYCGQVTKRDKRYPHVKNEFRESICSCTGTLPISAVKSCQCARVSGSGSTKSESLSKRTPRLLRLTCRVSEYKSHCSSNDGTSPCTSSGYRAGRFLRNRSQFLFRDYSGSNQSALLAWLKPATNVASSFFWCGGVAARAGQRRIEKERKETVVSQKNQFGLQQFEGFRTKKFT